MEVSYNGSQSCDKEIVLDKWKNPFCDLLNKPNSNSENIINNNHDVNLDSVFSIEEIMKVLNIWNNGKEPGVDMSIELFKNEAAVCSLHSICYMFESRKIPLNS